MLGAIYTALSGMNAYSQGLQTVSSNVANLNTNGYKADTITFSDLLGSSGAPSFQEGSPQPSGSGVRMASPFIDFSQGTLVQTGNALDLAIQGSGFLVLLNNGATFYARTGSFAIDKDGYIADQATGYRLAVLNASNQPVALNVNAKKTSAPLATTKISFSSNLSSSATTATVSSINVFDDRGGTQVWTVNFAKGTPSGTTPGVTNSWTVTVTDASGNTVGTGTLNFIGSTVDPGSSTISVTGNTTDGAKPINATLDFSGVTSFSAGTASTIATSSVDGQAEGTLTGVTVTQDGQVQLAYSNGQTVLEGAVALANVQDPQLLQRAGSGLYQNNGGADVTLLSSGVEGMGKLLSGQLESSNVNLANEFSRLILIQRGFQASSQVLSIANEMIQQLFAIRGQGG